MNAAELSVDPENRVARALAFRVHVLASLHDHETILARQAADDWRAAAEAWSYRPDGHQPEDVDTRDVLRANMTRTRDAIYRLDAMRDDSQELIAAAKAQLSELEAAVRHDLNERTTDTEEST